MKTMRAALFLAVLLAATGAEAQFQSDAGAGEQYHVEFSLRFWSPTPQLSLSTGSLASVGLGCDATDFDA